MSRYKVWREEQVGLSATQIFIDSFDDYDEAIKCADGQIGPFSAGIVRDGQFKSKAGSFVPFEVGG